MQGSEWYKECASIEVNKLRKYRDAISCLLEWEKFYDEWNWTGLLILRGIISDVIAQKAIEKVDASIEDLKDTVAKIDQLSEKLKAVKK